MTFRSVGICISEYRFMKLPLFLSRPTTGVTGGGIGTGSETACPGYGNTKSRHSHLGEFQTLLVESTRGRVASSDDNYRSLSLLLPDYID